MDKLFQLLAPAEPLPDHVKRFIEKHAIAVQLPKNHMLLEAPTIADHVYFLSSGYAMSYRMIEKKKRIQEFFKPNQLIVSPRSFFERIPSKESFQLLEDSEVIYLSYQTIMQLSYEFPKAYKTYQTIIVRCCEVMIERIHDFQNLTAIERYEKLLSMHEGIEQMVPQETIASYLGIAPQSLSRIKKVLRDNQ